jgi:hypothetical protein
MSDYVNPVQRLNNWKIKEIYPVVEEYLIYLMKIYPKP